MLHSIYKTSICYYVWKCSCIICHSFDTYSVRKLLHFVSKIYRLFCYYRYFYNYQYCCFKHFVQVCKKHSIITSQSVFILIHIKSFGIVYMYDEIVKVLHFVQSNVDYKGFYMGSRISSFYDSEKVCCILWMTSKYQCRKYGTT